jgi:hypothetical protein
MGLTNNAKNPMLDHLAGLAVYASIHTSDPGTSGTGELTGGSPAYARKPVTWNAASAGNLDNNANPLFDIPAGSTITHFGLWSAATAGTFYGGNALSASETFGGQGTYTLTDIDVSLS